MTAAQREYPLQVLVGPVRLAVLVLALSAVIAIFETAIRVPVGLGWLYRVPIALSRQLPLLLIVGALAAFAVLGAEAGHRALARVLFGAGLVLILSILGHVAGAVAAGERLAEVGDRPLFVVGSVRVVLGLGVVAGIWLGMARSLSRSAGRS